MHYCSPSYNSNHIIFIIFAKTDSHRELLCIYMQASGNQLLCESERLFDFVSPRGAKRQHKNISVPKRTDSLQMNGWLLSLESCFPLLWVGAVLSNKMILVHSSLFPIDCTAHFNDPLL